MSNILLGALALIMQEKISGRKCPECGAGCSLKVHKVNTDDYESFAKEKAVIMRCNKCGALVHDPLEHLSNPTADAAQMYGLRYVKGVEKIAGKITDKF